MCQTFKKELVARMYWKNNTWNIRWASINLDPMDMDGIYDGDEFDFYANYHDNKKEQK